MAEFLNTVQLGFIEKHESKLFFDSNWNTWDGGILGGKPVWLNPRDIPYEADLRCRHCDKPMAFLLEIYSPLDNPVEAFHRALYLFCCANANCFNLHSSVKCLRSQLSKINPFYSELPDTKSNLAEYRTAVCAVCGCRGSNKCSQCKILSYCCKEHQKEHWKQHKRFCRPAVDEAEIVAIQAAVPNGVFPHYSISVVEETLEDDDCVKDMPLGEGVDEEDDEGAEEALNEAAVNLPDEDRVYDAFLSRIERGGADQILRYRRWQEENAFYDHPADFVDDTDVSRMCQLRISAASMPPPVVPPCSFCGAPRKFEFQVMPQVLHFLRVDSSSVGIGDHDSVNALDWGSLDVYTCTASCDGASSLYKEEFVWKQPPATR